MDNDPKRQYLDTWEHSDQAEDHVPKNGRLFYGLSDPRETLRNRFSKWLKTMDR